MGHIYRIILFIIAFVYATSVELYSQATCGTTSVAVNGACSSVAMSGVVDSPTTTLCGGIPSPNKERWIQFVATTSPVTITVSMPALATNAFDLAFAVYNSPCTSGTITGSEIICVNNVGGTMAAQSESVSLSTPLITVGNTYFVRLFSTISYTPASNPSSTLCITGPPPNDDPGGAISLGAPTSGTCAGTQYNFTGASTSTCGGITTPTCGSYSGSSVDLWYSVVVPTDGKLFLQTAKGTLGNTGAGMEVYTATAPCTGMSLIGCSDGNPSGNGSATPPGSMSSMNIDNIALGGQTLYIRVWNKSTAALGTFSICANTLGPCGNGTVTTNDFCEYPASITTTGATGASLATGTVQGAYTNDTPGNLVATGAAAVNCGGVNDNSWFTFIATTSPLTIPFTVAGPTTTCAGIHAQIFSVTTTPEGCCKTFSPASGSPSVCAATTYSIAGATTGSITAASLTIGATYYLMISNKTGGQNCTYTVTGWSVSGILAVDFVNFKGNNEGKKNLIEWVTSSEKNVQTYTLEHSEDGVTYNPVITVSAAGNNASNKYYSVYDYNPFEDNTYYRIKQTETTGGEKYSNTINVSLRSKYDNIYNIQPNPTTDNLNFEYYSKANNSIRIELLGYAGNLVFKQNQPLEEGKNNITLPMSELDNGVYILKVVSEKSGKTTHHKIIKN